MAVHAVARARGESKTYVLVHGAWHGGWCWRAVADALRAKGHCDFVGRLARGKLDRRAQRAIGERLVGGIDAAAVGSVALGHTVANFVFHDAAGASELAQRIEEQSAVM